VTTFVTSAEEAVATIRSGQNIWVHSMAASPVLLLQALAKHALDLQGLTVMQMHLEHAEALADPALYGRLRNRVFFASSSTRDLINNGLADYVPVFLSEIPRLLRQGYQSVDVALVQVSPPDRHGFCSLGVSVEVTRAACEVAKKIIAHINPNMPRSHGDSYLALSDIDVAFEQAADVIEHIPYPITPDMEAIGRQVAELVRDGDCLQLGIGGVPDAVLACLGDHRHLGIHTEMFSDGLLPLLESGVVDNSNKNIHPGKVVATFVMGTRKLYDFVDDNPLIRMLDVQYVNNIATIRKNRQMVSINSAIQVDLTGQVCSRFHRQPDLLRGRRATGFCAGRATRGRGSLDHCAAQYGGGRHSVAHRALLEPRRRCGNHSRPRGLHCHGVRGGAPEGQIAG
jgi:acyl-CoA hydrolase